MFQVKFSVMLHSYGEEETNTLFTILGLAYIIPISPIGVAFVGLWVVMNLMGQVDPQLSAKGLEQGVMKWSKGSSSHKPPGKSDSDVYTRECVSL